MKQKQFQEQKKETESENKNSLTIKIQDRMKTTVKTMAAGRAVTTRGRRAGIPARVSHAVSAR